MEPKHNIPSIVPRKQSPSVTHDSTCDTYLTVEQEIPLNQIESIDVVHSKLLVAWATLWARINNESTITFPHVSIDSPAKSPNTASLAVELIHLNFLESPGIQAAVQKLQENKRLVCSRSASELRLIDQHEPGEHEGLVHEVLLLSSTHTRRDPIMEKLRIRDLLLMGFSESTLFMHCFLDSCSIHISASSLRPARLERTLSQFNHLAYQVFQSTGNTLCLEVDILCPEDLEYLGQHNRLRSKVIPTHIHDMIETRARAQPEALAVRSWDTCLTYSELEQTSHRIAMQIQLNGVKPRDIVPIAMQKSSLVVIAMLAVLQSDAAFVLLDITMPPARLQMIIEKCKANLVLCDTFATPLLSALDIELLNIEKVHQGLDRTVYESFHDLPTSKPENPAYIVFTSGSMGAPKGVVIQHVTFCSAVLDQAAALQIDNSSRVLQLASYSFSACMVEILTTLVVGGCVCIPTDFEKMNDLAGAMNKLAVTWVVMPPSLTAVLPPDSVPSLETLVLGAEPLSSGVVKKWAEDVKLLHAYGQSECCTISSTKALQRFSDPRNMGQPFAMNAWIVESYDYHQLCPVGGIGELLFEGPSIGLEYLDEPQLTKAAFVEAPRWTDKFPEVKNSRFFRTGDLAKYNNDGTLSILGRKDAQCKIRGVRIEIAEVEYHIRPHLNMNETVVVDVVAPEGQLERKALACFCNLLSYNNSKVPGDKTEEPLFMDIKSWNANNRHDLQAFVLRITKHLAEHLPTIMIPTVFIPVRSVPLTGSGKIDRRKLRTWASEQSVQTMASYVSKENDAEKVPPSSPMEKQLCSLFSQILKIPETVIGSRDTFVKLGGDSITAIALISKARQANLILEVQAVLSELSLAQLASQAGSHHGELLKTPSAPIPFSLLNKYVVDDIFQKLECRKYCVQDCFPVTDFQRRALEEAESPTRGLIEYLKVNLDGEVDINYLRYCCDQLVQQYEIFRTVFVSNHNTYFQVVLKEAALEFSTYDTDDVERCFQRICKNDISEASESNLYTKFLYFKQDAKRGMLVMRLSHAQMDGISIPIIWRNLKLLYEGNHVCRAAQFSPFMYALEQHKTEECFRYWSEMLNGVPFFPILTKPAAPNCAYDLTISRSVRRPDLANIGITTATVVKSAWALTLSKMTSNGDVVFSQLISGRNIVNIENIQDVIGPFINENPVRVNIQPEWTGKDLLSHVQHQHVQSMKYETLGLGEIVNKCMDWPKGARLDSMVQYQNIEDDRNFTMGGINCRWEVHDQEPDLEDIRVLAIPRADNLDVAISASSTKFSHGELQAIADQYTTYLAILSTSSDDEVANFA